VDHLAVDFARSLFVSCICHEPLQFLRVKPHGRSAQLYFDGTAADFNCGARVDA